MIRTYRIKFFEGDADRTVTSNRIERAYTADDAMTQFRVWADEHADRAFPTEIVPLDVEPSPREISDANLQRAKASATGLTPAGWNMWEEAERRFRTAEARVAELEAELAKLRGKESHLG